MLIGSKKWFVVLTLFAPFSFAGNFLDGAIFTQIANITMTGQTIYVDPLPSLTFKDSNLVILNFEMIGDGINCDGIQRQCTYTLGKRSECSIVLDIMCNKTQHRSKKLDQICA